MQETPRDTPPPAGPLEETTILTQIASIVTRITEIPAAWVVPDATFVTDLGIDSISMLEILEGVHAILGVPVRDEDAADLTRVEDLTRYVAAGRRSDARPGS